jgi:hypothetical protein
MVSADRDTVGSSVSEIPPAIVTVLPVIQRLEPLQSSVIRRTINIQFIPQVLTFPTSKQT